MPAGKRPPGTETNGFSTYPLIKSEQKKMTKPQKVIATHIQLTAPLRLNQPNSEGPNPHQSRP